MIADRFLLAGRIGRWQWPWAVIGTAVTLALVLGIGNLTAPLETWLTARYGGTGEDVHLIPGRPDTFISFVLFVLTLMLPPALVLFALHGIAARSPLGRHGRWQWDLFIKAALAFLAVMLAGLVVGLLTERQNYRWLDRGLAHVPWVLLAVIVIFLQSFAEEYLFKGYLLRIWGALVPFRLPIVTVIAVLFTGGHAINDDVASDLIFNLVFFFAAEVITLMIFLRTESLAAVTGLHWMNNMWAMSVVATEPGQSAALALAAYTDPFVSKGQSRLSDLYSYVEMGAGLGLLWLLLTWPRSPMYLGDRPADAAPAEPFPQSLPILDSTAPGMECPFCPSLAPAMPRPFLV